MTSDYTPTPQETAKEKDDIIKDVIPELKEHGLVDLTDYINKHNRLSFTNNPGFVRSVAYKLEEMGEAGVMVKKRMDRVLCKKKHL